MKLIPFILLFSCCTYAKAQDEQLIIRVPQQSEKNVARISRQLHCLEGVHFSGYVKDASCLLVKYNRDVYLDASIILTAIHHLNKKMSIEVIKGLTAYDVIDGKLAVESSYNK